VGSAGSCSRMSRESDIQGTGLRVYTELQVPVGQG